MELFLFGFMPALPFLGVLVALSVLTPSWRWVAGFIALAWLALAVVWGQHWIVASQPGYNEGPGGAMGLIAVGTVTDGVIFGTVIYAGFMLWLWSRK